jgi:hypothetical protein
MPQVTDQFGPYPVSAVLNASGSGTATFQPNGSNVRITNLFVKVSTSVNQAVVTLYRGSVADSNAIGNTQSGSTGSIATGSIDLHDGETLYIVWTGGDVGASAIATLTGHKVNFNQVTSATSLTWESPIAAGDGSLIFPAVKSPNYVTGTSGWIIKRDGTAEFANVTVRGTFTAGNGNVTVDSNGITVFDQTLPYVYSISRIGGFIAKDVPDTGSIAQIYPSNFLTRPATPTALGNNIAPNGIVNSFSFAAVGVDERAYLDLKSPGINGTSSDQAEILLESTATVSGNPANIILNPRGGTIKTGDFSGGFSDMGRGIVVAVDSGVNSAAIGLTETVTLTSPSWTFLANHAYRIDHFSRYSLSAAGASQFVIAYRKNNLAGASISNTGRQDMDSNLTAYKECRAIFIVGAANVTCAIAQTLVNSVAAPTLTQQIGRSFQIVDLGDAGPYSNQMVLS